MTFFEKLWKKSNRGLWLGLLLIVVWVCVAVVGAVSVKVRKNEIAKTVIDATQAILDSNGQFGGTLGEDYTDEEKAAAKAAVSAAVNRYWSDTVPAENDAVPLIVSYSEWFSKTDIPEHLDDHLAHGCLGLFSEFDFDADTSDFKVGRNGPGYVVVSSRASLPVTYSSEAFFGSQPFVGSYSYYLGWGDGENAVKERKTMHLDVSAELRREKGEWKITRMSVSGYPSSDLYYAE